MVEKCFYKNLGVKGMITYFIVDQIELYFSIIVPLRLIKKFLGVLLFS